MKIVHLSTSDQGGAFKAAYLLHLGLLQQGVESKMLVLYQYNKGLKEVYPFLEGQTFLQRVRNSLKARCLGLVESILLLSKPKMQFSFHFSPYDILGHTLVKSCDIVHLHWVANFLDYDSFFTEVAKPVVWTLHDMNPLLGGFHYEVYRSSAYQKLDGWVVKKKKLAWDKSKSVTIVAPSQWLYQESKRATPVKRHLHCIIPYGINLNSFKPSDKQEAKQKLSLPRDKKAVLFIAESLEDVRKGKKEFESMLKGLQEVVLLTVGSGKVESGIHPCFSFGYVRDESFLATVYAAADVFVHTSLEDNLPNTVLESLACGTPVVGFQIGGMPDMIQEGYNGYLVEKGDASALSSTVSRLLSDEKLLQVISENARASVLRFSPEGQASKYLELYKNLTK